MLLIAKGGKTATENELSIQLMTLLEIWRQVRQGSSLSQRIRNGQDEIAIQAQMRIPLIAPAAVREWMLDLEE